MSAPMSATDVAILRSHSAMTAVWLQKKAVSAAGIRLLSCFELPR